MIIIKPILEQFKNADETTKLQLWKISAEEAFKQAVSEDELKKKFDVLNAQLAGINKLADDIRKLETKINDLELSVKKLSEPKQLKEVDLVKTEPKKSFWLWRK